MTQSKDWTGNTRSTHAVLGARNFTEYDRENNDYYATDPYAATLLMEQEKFSPYIWECACGEGHLSKEFEKAGYKVYSSDIVDRGFGRVQDFLTSCFPPPCRDSTSSQIRPTQKHRILSNTRLTS